MNKALPGRLASRSGKNSGGGEFRLVADAGVGKTRTLVFGSATLKGVARVAGEAGVLFDPPALERIKAALTEPGVELPMHAGKPVFIADPEQPDRIVRIWKGKREAGTFVDGEFKLAK